MARDLDDVDRGILHALQENAREATAAEMAEAVGVSASTVRNRIDRLESAGVIRGYRPEIDYERAGFQLHVFVVCRVAPGDRSSLAAELLELSGVVRVRELLTGTENLHVEAVATDSAAVDDLLVDVAGRGIEIVSSDIVNTTHVQPFDHFGADAESDG
ncbi:AsnC family transcriptional regulator [Halosimplex carlsbadense 2-9-1]|uniref:AsnC family transcriptional regulator n=1 Tax=Halosimplex carlsbadense 2-9-1 TaxID=797114 RepID=M0D002_9EURY|nr:Lrp/AsnC family transcriptional regulator [Halosimplex carlsbadense]ELZ27464.1 AsnC family transcriptional regulator [Halosimplex carlsbadense 2-9-1]